MKKVLYIIAIGAMSASFVQAEMSPYISLSGGYAGLFKSDIEWTGGGGEIEYKDGYVIEGAVGTGFDSVPMRAELALSYQGNDLDTFTETGGTTDDASDSSLSAIAFMLNGYYDIKTESAFTPYLLAGLGFTSAEVDFGDTKEDDTVFTGQLGIGVGYAVTDNLIIDLKYKFMASQAIEFTDEDEKIEIDLSGQQVQLGVRFLF